MAAEVDGIRGELKGWGRRIDGMLWRRIYGMRGQIGGKKKSLMIEEMSLS
ncbi:MAG: hypothetical protein SOZ25_04120 [Prevotella sp.]|nr:hypothetical protein [Prevotella sp.]